MQLPYANVRIRHWNPGASMPLVLPVHLICNTSDDEIFENIQTNSRARGNWIKLSPPHDKVAVLCGSGPSLIDTLGEIRERASVGQVIFALNGAAAFLNANGIIPDYQVIIDARLPTADLVGPAKAHLFASQVSPECFKRAPDAQLWHLQVGNIETLLPDYKDDYCLIGGAASVGNTATCLAFAMGFRNLQIYGYDSCHRGDNGHAFRQPMNDGDPLCVVPFNGKEYTASLTMKLQAEKFQETSRALRDAGCHIEVHGSGLLPDMYRAPPEVLEQAEKEYHFWEVDAAPAHDAASERAKYQRMWEHPEYRVLAPGEKLVGRAIAALGMKRGQSIIDFGCGTGRAAQAFIEHGFHVNAVDFAANCLDEGIDIPFCEANLWELPHMIADHGFCCDVMEHIPPDKVDRVLLNIRRSVPSAFFNIAFVPDNLGSLIGEPLHLTVRSPDWWLAQLKQHWRDVSFVDGAFICKA